MVLDKPFDVYIKTAFNFLFVFDKLTAVIISFPDIVQSIKRMKSRKTRLLIKLDQIRKNIKKNKYFPFIM